MYPVDGSHAHTVQSAALQVHSSTGLSLCGIDLTKDLLRALTASAGRQVQPSIVAIMFAFHSHAIHAHVSDSMPCVPTQVITGVLTPAD